MERDEQTHILIVEDDAAINDVVSTRLRKEGFQVTSAFSGTEAKLLLKDEAFDLVVTDLMLPGMTGEDMVALVRRDLGSLPIIVISARVATADKVSLLQQGADDYLSKPFDLDELVARVQVQLRRTVNRSDLAGSDACNEKTLAYRDWQMRPVSRSFLSKGEAVQLTRTEFDMLALLMAHPTRVFTKQELYEHTWAEPYTSQDSTVAAHISNLRSKLRPSGTDDYIQTVWGIGFKLS